MALEVATLTKCGVPEPVARRQLPYMQSAMRKYGITTRPRARAFLATVLHESMGLRATTEQASGARYEGRRDLGNIHRGDGQRFKGRGPIQLTGRANYAAYGRRLGMNLEAHPDMVANPEVGWQVAGMFFQKCLPAADAGDFRRVTRLVNGGLNGWDDRLRYWNKLAGLGVVPGTPDIRRGAKGPKVQMLSRRLSYLVSEKSGKPFLNGARSTFDRSTTRALRRFQKERGLKVDGVFGPRVAAELDQLVRAEKARRRKRRPAAPAVATQPTVAAQPAVPRTPRPAPPAETPAPPVAAAHGHTPPAGQRPAHRDRVDRLWRRLERLDALGDRLRAELATFNPAATAAPQPGEPGAEPVPPVVAPPPGPPAEQLGTPELIESLKRVDADQARVLAALEARLSSLDQAREQAATPPAATADVPVPVAAPAPSGAAVPTTNGESAAPAPAGNGSAAHIRELERLEQEADRLRAILEERVLDAEELGAGAQATPPVENATMQRFMALVGQIDAIDAKSDRVRKALRLATGHAAEVHASSAGTAATANGGAGGGAASAVAQAEPPSSGARTFRLQTQPMKGDDVRNWQVHLNKQLKKLKVDFEIGVDGEYGGETARWSKRVLYALGLTSGKWEGVTPALRIKARNPRRRTPAEVGAARKRAPWQRKLRKSHDAPKGGIRAAIMYAKKHADRKTHETRTNGGPFIDDWCRAVALQPGTKWAFWCGAFANACLVQGGLPSRTWIRYTPSIVKNAKAGVEGWSWHATPKIGDLVLFNWPGGDFVDHVGIVVETHPDGSIKTVEGNMSNRVDYWQRRSMILGYARPPWKRSG